MTNLPRGSDPHDRIVLVRGPIARDWADRLDHLGIDLKMTRPKLVAEAVALLLRYHGVADGLPEPTSPKPRTP